MMSVSSREKEPSTATLPSETGAGDRPGSSRRWLRMLPWALFVAALVAAVAFGVLWRGARATDRERAEVASAASAFLSALTNFSGSTIEADVEEIRSFAVGGFADQVETFFDRDAMDALRDAGSRSEGRIRSIFVESISGQSAAVFGVVDESVTNASSSVPRAEVIRIEIQMIETTEGWKVERVNILQSPAEGPLVSEP